MITHDLVPHTEPSPDDRFDQRVEVRLSSLSPAAQRVVRYIDRNRLTVLSTSAADIAETIGASDATVVRAVQALGYSGLAELRQALVTSMQAEPTIADSLKATTEEVGEGVELAVSAVIATHVEMLQMLTSAEIQSIIVRAIRLLNEAKRIVVFGIGPSAALSEYMAFLLMRHGRRARTLNATGDGLADQLLDLRVGDALILLAYGRTYREIVVVIDEARRLRLPIVLVTDTLDAKLARQADVIVPALRGKQARVKLHGVTVIVLEAIVLGLAFTNASTAMQTLGRLADLREKIRQT